SSRYDDVMRKYHQLVHGIDFATGMILDALKENGALDNTVIIYTSDNGFLCGSHGYGSKVLPYEESVRVPMIIFDPRHKSRDQGIRVSALTGNIDIAPTILELAGLKADPETEGKSLLSLLDEPEKEIHSQLYLMNCWGPAAAQSLGVVTRDWKYIYWYYGKDMNPTEELFDMRKDKLELFNVANDSQQKKALQFMRGHYDKAVASIKNKAAPTHKVYGKLFDRKIPWNQKKSLINPFKNK
ncbi:MAG: sulfatase/phosphatase domain-containing protein, partial [Verrucomicrobiota bacterium]|nr:sulfatase/phosphatase domain-containing protein [Verrucomicrobiota bacterium]